MNDFYTWLPNIFNYLLIYDYYILCLLFYWVFVAGKVEIIISWHFSHMKELKKKKFVLSEDEKILMG
jgi:hypothetical protein